VGTEDEVLMDRVRTGDLTAFDELVRRHQQAIFRVAYHLVGNTEEAADVTQNAFVRAFRSIGSFRGQASFGTWMYRITVNVAKNHLRSWGRQRRGLTFSLEASSAEDPEAAPPALEVADPASDPRREAISVEIATQVQRALRELTPLYRAALVLRDIEGMSYEEVALAVQAPIGTVKAQVHRARLRLRDVLKKRGWGPNELP
jgi:RNA polymerase sigma-70 factor (ECF subfamily)